MTQQLNRRLPRRIRHALAHLVAGHILRSPTLATMSAGRPTSALTTANFQEFAYSKYSHFSNFEIPDPYQGYRLEACELKVYQDLFIYNFLLRNVKPGAKLLEIGGGES